MLTYRAGRLMDQQWNINGAPDSIRGLVRTIVGDSKPSYLVALIVAVLTPHWPHPSQVVSTRVFQIQ
ncbi:hypothetical protein MF6394_23500 [Pseudomonas sp. MF6394]|nr:hypothetical protein MF6394_23500 [Pseudomonas sp. MF6394]